MKKISRVLSFFMACVICFSDISINIYAAQSVSTNYIESETDGYMYDEEVKTDEVVLEEDEIIEETTTTSDNEIQDIENLNKTKDDGVLDFEVVRVDWDKIDGEIYDAEEFVDTDHGVLLQEGFAELHFVDLIPGNPHRCVDFRWRLFHESFSAPLQRIPVIRGCSHSPSGG